VVFADQSEDSVPVLPLSESRQSATNAPGRRRISMHRACVVGGLFELVSLDDRNRLKVRFDWGNQGDGARFNDCWIPVDLALLQGNNPWWGGMEVIVSFRDDNPDDPFISNRLWDPDINPRTQPEPVSLPRRIITTRIDREMFLDESRQFTVDDELIVRMARNNEMHFRVGSSLVTIDSKSVSLSGLKIMLSSIAEAQGEGE
jgi:hypothetical protein